MNYLGKVINICIEHIKQINHVILMNGLKIDSLME